MSLKEILSLGFDREEDEDLKKMWYKVVFSSQPKYPKTFFEEGKAPYILHPQAVFGRNAFTQYCAAGLNERLIQGMKVPCLVGFDNRSVSLVDFTKIIHLLVSGVTGAGKSTGIYGILFSMMWLNLPKWLRIEIYATKGVRMFEDVANVYDDLDAMREGAKQLVQRMFKRMERLKKDKELYTIDLYNAKNRDNPMRYEVVVVDEIANIYKALEGEEKEQFKKDIVLIAAQGRSLGMHLIVAPQRPDVSSLPSDIKSQIPSSLTFRMKTQYDAQTAGQPRAVVLEPWHAILSGNVDWRHLRMPRIEAAWVPFFAKRIKKTIEASGFAGGFK